MGSDEVLNEGHNQSTAENYIPLSTTHVALSAAVVDQVLCKLIFGLDEHSQGDE